MAKTFTTPTARYPVSFLTDKRILALSDQAFVFYTRLLLCMGEDGFVKFDYRLVPRMFDGKRMAAQPSVQKAMEDERWSELKQDHEDGSLIVLFRRKRLDSMKDYEFWVWAPQFFTHIDPRYPVRNPIQRPIVSEVVWGMLPPTLDDMSNLETDVLSQLEMARSADRYVEEPEDDEFEGTFKAHERQFEGVANEEPPENPISYTNESEPIPVVQSQGNPTQQELSDTQKAHVRQTVEMMFKGAIPAEGPERVPAAPIPEPKLEYQMDKALAGDVPTIDSYVDRAIAHIGSVSQKNITRKDIIDVLEQSGRDPATAVTLLEMEDMRDWIGKTGPEVIREVWLGE